MRYRNPRINGAKRHVLAAALASCLLMASGAHAQSTSSTLRGTVTTQEAPAPGAEVVVTNTATGLTRRTLSREDGGYSIAGLPPGTYRIEVDAGGRMTQQVVTLAVAQTATVDLGVDGAALADATTLESVEVIGVSVQETRTSEISTFITPQQIDALPQVSRNFLAFADIVPGVQFEEGQDGSTRLRGGAQNSNGINVYIDGVGQKNYVLKGGISGQDSSRGSPFPQSAISEYKVITQNYKAEFDQLSSAAVVAATKSGTNEFEGNVFYDRTTDSWRATRPSEALAGKLDTKDEQYGVSLGGPIVQDLLHFFVSYEAKELVSPRDITLGTNIDPATVPDDLRDLLGSVTAPFDMDLYFGKLTWSPDENNIVDFTVKVRNESEITGLGGANTASYGSSKDTEETRADLRWQYSNERFLNEMHITHEDSFFAPRPVTIGPGYNFVGGPNRDAIINLGGGRDYQDKGQKGYGFQNDFTIFAGDHTLKMGFKYKNVEINAFEQQPYNPQYQFRVEDIAAGYTDPSQVTFGAIVPGLNDRNITSKNKQYGLYFQDDWEVNDKLILNLGLRWDYEEAPGYLDYVTRPELVTALRGWSNLQNADYDIEDYISNGNNREAFKDAFQPRIGFSYDLFGDEQHVLFGGIGRSYDRNLWDYLALEQSKGTFPAYEYRFAAPSNPDCATQANCLGEWNDSYLDPQVLYALVAANPNLGGEINLMNNNLKTPYSDQLSFGVRNTVGQWNTSVTLSRVESHDGIIFSLGNRWPDGSFRDPNRPGSTWGGQPWGFPIPGFGTLIKADNGIETRANSLLVSLEKPFTEASNWGTTIALTFTDAEENRSNAAASDEHYVFDYPSLDEAGWQRAVGVPRSRLVATGIVGLPWDVRLSGKITVESPVVKDAVDCYTNAHPQDYYCQFNAFEVDGTFGHRQVDLSLTKDFRFGEDYSANFRIDALNVFNHTNYLDYDTWRGNFGGPNTNFQARNGLATAWPPRMVKLSVGFNW